MVFSRVLPVDLEVEGVFQWPVSSMCDGHRRGVPRTGTIGTSFEYVKCWWHLPELDHIMFSLGGVEVSVSTMMELFRVLRKRIPGRFLPKLGLQSLLQNTSRTSIDFSLYGQT